MQPKSELLEPRQFVIAVGIDFSAPSQHALALARSLAHEHAPAVIHAVHVTGLPDMSERGVHVDVERELERMRCECGSDEHGECVVCHVLIGRAEDELAEFSSECDVDVLIVGEREKHGLQRFFSRSMSQRIARAAECSVLVAHEDDEPLHGLGSAQQRNPSE